MNRLLTVKFGARSPDGYLYAVLAYTSWGLLPMFWKCFGQMPAVEVVSHRIVWSMVVLLGVLVYQQRMGELKTLWKSPQDWGALVITASLLAFNWGLYLCGEYRTSG